MNEQNKFNDLTKKLYKVFKDNNLLQQSVFNENKMEDNQTITLNQFRDMIAKSNGNRHLHELNQLLNNQKNHFNKNKLNDTESTTTATLNAMLSDNKTENVIDENGIYLSLDLNYALSKTLKKEFQSLNEKELKNEDKLNVKIDINESQLHFLNIYFNEFKNTNKKDCSPPKTQEVFEINQELNNESIITKINTIFNNVFKNTVYESFFYVLSFNNKECNNEIAFSNIDDFIKVNEKQIISHHLKCENFIFNILRKHFSLQLLKYTEEELEVLSHITNNFYDNISQDNVIVNLIKEILFVNFKFMQYEGVDFNLIRINDQDNVLCYQININTVCDYDDVDLSHILNSDFIFTTIETINCNKTLLTNAINNIGINLEKHNLYIHNPKNEDIDLNSFYPQELFNLMNGISLELDYITTITRPSLSKKYVQIKIVNNVLPQSIYNVDYKDKNKIMLRDIVNINEFRFFNITFKKLSLQCIINYICNNKISFFRTNEFNQIEFKNKQINKFIYTNINVGNLYYFFKDEIKECSNVKDVLFILEEILKNIMIKIKQQSTFDILLRNDNKITYMLKELEYQFNSFNKLIDIDYVSKIDNRKIISISPIITNKITEITNIIERQITHINDIRNFNDYNDYFYLSKINFNELILKRFYNKKLPAPLVSLRLNLQEKQKIAGSIINILFQYIEENKINGNDIALLSVLDRIIMDLNFIFELNNQK